MTMMVPLAGHCTNTMCFVAEAKEIVRPQRGFNFTCWHCGQALAAAPVPMRARPRLAGAGAALAGTVLVAIGLTLGVSAVAHSAPAHGAPTVSVTR